MSKLFVATLAILTVVLALSVFAGTTKQSDEPCVPCSGTNLLFYIVNDTFYTHALTYPHAGVTDFSGCITGDETDTIPMLFFPDTIPYTKVVDSLLALHAGVPESVTVAFKRFWYGGVATDLVQIPPAPRNNCRDIGIYFKARIFDVATSGWSRWRDVYMAEPRAHYAVFDPDANQLFILIGTDGFKTYGGADLTYNCNVDSVQLYVWDVDNTDGATRYGAGTWGEFAAVTWVVDSLDPYIVAGWLMDTMTVFLKRYRPPVGIDEKPAVPAVYYLTQNTPNPFNAKTLIEYGLPEDAQVEISVTNLLGQKVVTLVDEFQSVGAKRVVWDGRDLSGRELPSGVYFYSIKANNFSDKKRAILMK